MKILQLVILISCVVLFDGCKKESPEQALHQIFDEAWEFGLQEFPLGATGVGDNRFNDRLAGMSMADLERRYNFYKEMHARLTALDRSQFDRDNRINYDLFERQLSDNIKDFEFKAYQIPLTVDGGFHIYFANLPNQVPLKTVADYENYIKRLQAFPKFTEEHIALMREGVKEGRTLAKVILDGYEVTIQSHVVDSPEKSVFYPPFEKFPATVPEGEHARLEKAGSAAIMESVVAGYQMFLDFMMDEYIPGARETIGAFEMPNGREYYDQRVRYFTTLDISVEEIHDLGLQEVKRIRGEMAEIIKSVNFKGGFAEFLTFLRTDPRFYPKTPRELLMEASFISKKMDGKLPSLFKTLPRTPYGVAPVPDHLAPKYTAGRYVGTRPGSTRPGYYWVNTYSLENRPLYALEALSLHEAVPGHHLQISLAQEMENENMPKFRKYSYISAFGEGWGLYSEWLGLEAGFYTDPYSNFGRLTYEMWRACRLVVDTGIHAMGWTRQQVLDYMASNTALSLLEVRTETDRYISWPGQALSYKIGELKIKELRRLAEEKLQEKFDIREFHEVILRNGSVTLPILEEEVNEYIANAARG